MQKNIYIDGRSVHPRNEKSVWACSKDEADTKEVELGGRKLKTSPKNAMPV